MNSERWLTASWQWRYTDYTNSREGFVVFVTVADNILGADKKFAESYKDHPKYGKGPAGVKYLGCASLIMLGFKENLLT